MTFKIGDKVRLKQGYEEWREYFTKERIKPTDQTFYLNQNQHLKNSFKEPYTVEGYLYQDSGDKVLNLRDADNNHLNIYSFRLILDESQQEENEYETTEQGFRTHQKNWDKWLI